MTQPDLFLFVGEHSGDLHGEALLQKLCEKRNDLNIIGVSGPRMRALGAKTLGFKTLMDMESFQVMGFIDVLFALPKIWRAFRFLKKEILRLNPKICLFIDYPGFNLMMEKALRNNGYAGKIFHYVSPSVWAWKKNRIHTLENNIDALFSILPFEKNFYKHSNLEVEYVGHPLAERLIQEEIYELPIDPERLVIASFAGSRKKEMIRNLPYHMAAFEEVQKKFPKALFAISCVDEAMKTFIEATWTLSPDWILVYPKHTYGLMKRANLAFAKSGTVTLELALLGTPTVITYAVTRLDQFIATKIFNINLKYYSLPNLILGEEVFKEFIGTNLILANVVQEALRLLEDPSSCKALLSTLKARLGEKKPSLEITNRILLELKTP